MPSNVDVVPIDHQRPELQTVFTEFMKVIKWCGRKENWYGFPAALLAFSMIQAIGLYLDGHVDRSNNKCQFYMALDKYFPAEYSKSNVRKKLWERARCCLSHDLTVCGGVGISWDPDARDLHLQKDAQGVLTVSMIELTKHLEEAINTYLHGRGSDPCLKAKYNAVIQELEKM